MGPSRGAFFRECRHSFFLIVLRKQVRQYTGRDHGVRIVENDASNSSGEAKRREEEMSEKNVDSAEQRR